MQMPFKHLLETLLLFICVLMLVACDNFYYSILYINLLFTKNW